MRKTPHYWAIQILLVLLIVLVATKVQFLFNPLIILITTLFLPVVISGFFYFITIPLLDFLVKKKVPRLLGIVIVIITLISVIFFIGSLIIPVVLGQLVSIVDNIPHLVDEIQLAFENFSDSKYYDMLKNQTYISLEQLQDKLVSIASSVVDGITNSVQSILSALSNAILVICIAPFMYFYMLKDGEGLKGAIIKILPDSFNEEAGKIISETYDTLGRYIQGQLLSCTFVAVMSSIGYFLIGLPYALTFGLFIGIFNMIPYLGPWIGSAPAVIVAFLISPSMGVLSILVICVVQFTESNVISPLIHGHNLKMHPLTVIIVMILAGKVFGIFGMLLAIPTYAVTKVLVINLSRILKVRRESQINS